METPADPQPVAAATTPPDSEPTWLSGTPPAEAAPIAATRQASALSEAAAAFAGKISVIAVSLKKAAQGLWRQATAQAHALKSQRPPRKQRAQLRPDVPAVGDEPAERPAKAKKKKTRSLRAAILVGLGLIGGVALMQFGDLELPEALDGALPAAEMNDEGSQLANAAGSTELVETDAGPLPGQALASGSAGQALADGSAGAEGLDPVETAPAEIQPAPPELEITTPSAPDVAALEVDLALLEPAASEPIPIGSSFTPLATGNPTQRPTFIPYDVPPKLENAGEIQRLLERGYPSQLRDAGIEGTVILWIFVDAQGAVQKMEVKESSGYELMDEAALSTAEKMRFAPAMNRDKATPVWLAQPITFR
jgi:protein TonB